MSIPNKSSGRSLKNDLRRMSSVFTEAINAYARRQYKRCHHKLYELSVLLSEYSKKG